MRLCDLLVNTVDGALTTYIHFINKAINFCLGIDEEKSKEDEESKEDIFFEK
jgi:hypothetical protein